MDIARLRNIITKSFKIHFTAIAALLVLVPAVAFFLIFAFKNSPLFGRPEDDGFPVQEETEVEQQEPLFTQAKTEDWVFYKGTKQLEYTGELSGFVSSDEETATVEDGTVTGIQPGSVTITAYAPDGSEAKWKVEVKKIAYLTIDDWPGENTEKILDTLDRYGIKATFFLVAEKKDYDLYQKIIDGGHTIGNHTYSHNMDRIYSSSSSMKISVWTMEEWLNENFDVSAGNLLRFPGGTTFGGNNEKWKAFNELSYNGYRIYDWTCITGDAAADATAESVYQNVVNTLQDNREIILMHHKAHTAEALPRIIEYARSQGYEFDVIGEDTPVYNFQHGWSDE